jgi:catechol 2,3-dioxygenase-like lactoylglutathione lyase family enzyme
MEGLPVDQNPDRSTAFTNRLVSADELARKIDKISVLMAKVAARKLAKKKRIGTKKRAAPERTKASAQRTKKASRPQPEAGDKLSFNHAMVYVKDVQRALDFYRDLLGFKLVDEFRHEGRPVYARLRAPGGDGTIALHMAGPGTSLASEGVRLYFEIRELDDFCQKLQARHFYITQMPRMMPWGWRHAYLNDPDGHEISLYWAGENRMKKTVMQTAKEVEKTPAAKGC